MHPLVIVGGLTVLGKIFQERTLPWAGKPRGWAVKKPFGYSYAEEEQFGAHQNQAQIATHKIARPTGKAMRHAGQNLRAGVASRRQARVGETFIYTKDNTEALVHDFAQEMAEAAEEYGEHHGYTKRECAAIYLHTYRNLGGYRRDNINDCQRDMGLPETGVYDPRTTQSMGTTLDNALRERAHHQAELQARQ